MPVDSNITQLPVCFSLRIAETNEVLKDLGVQARVVPGVHSELVFRVTPEELPIVEQGIKDGLFNI